MEGNKQEHKSVGTADGRPAWDDYFLDIVGLVAKRATCLRRRVGAALVRDRRILSTGYNGAPTGLRHCLEIGCLRERMNIPSGERHELCRGLHAEQNAIIQAALTGHLVLSTLHTNDAPSTISRSSWATRWWRRSPTPSRSRS